MRGVRVAVFVAVVASGLAAVPEALAAPPPNDDFATATVVTEPLPYQDTVDTSDATGAPTDPECYTQAGDPENETVWYTYTPSVDGRIQANTRNLHYDDTLSAYVEVVDAFSGEVGGSSAVNVDAVAGETLYFMIGTLSPEHFGGGLVVFNVKEAPIPPNDDIADAATVIEPLPYQEVLESAGASGAPNDPGCLSNPGDPDQPTVWYAYTPASNGLVNADTLGSDYATTLSAYVDDGGTMVQIDCRPETWSGAEPAMTVEVSASETVFFMVGTQGGEPGGGRMVFNVDNACAGGEPTLVGTSQPDRLVGTPGPDVIWGLGGDDIICGGPGNDLIKGGAGNDELHGDAGRDRLIGQAHDDLLYGGNGPDTLTGRGGDDFIDGGPDDDLVSYAVGSAVVLDLAAGTATGHGVDTLVDIEHIQGSGHGDTLKGDEQPNIIKGGPDDDVLVGRGGDDRLKGQKGTDTANGGRGVDFCGAESITNCEFP